ncbi:MAG: hypothetical protein WCE46_09110 [Methanoregula sp.]|jgi:hypothetical protein|uniref:hypothetical protein n=1 Tax=Methanoregula sp. TaxID=2052170 RepID=UPI003C768727
MLENITCQIVTSQFSDSSNWWNNISLTIQLLGSFVIALIILLITQYLTEKSEFESTMNWFITEGDYLRSIISPKIDPIEENINTLDALPPDRKDIRIFDFPDFKLDSLDFIISKGYFQFFSEIDSTYLIQIKMVLARLQYNKNSYDLLNSKSSQLTPENFKTQQRTLLKGIQERMDYFVYLWDQPRIKSRIKKYPKSILTRWLKST